MKKVLHKAGVAGVIIMVLILLLAALPACGGGPEVPKEIVLGTTIGLTGMGAGFGQGGAFGLKAAVDDINKLGGVYVTEYDSKLSVKLVILDNESDPAKAGTLTEDLLVNQKANFLLSPPQWPPFIAAMATVAERYQTPFVAFAGPFEPNNALRMAAGPWKYTWESGFAIGAPPPPGDFRNIPGYTMMDLWMAFLGKYAGQTNKIMGAFASDDPDGRGWYEAFTGALTAAGFTIIGKDKELGIAPLDTTDFTSIIKEWQNNKAEILIGNAPGPWFGTLWRQARTLGYKPKMVIAERAAMIYSDVNAWGGDLPWGVTALVEWVPSIKAPGIGDTTPESLDARWKAETGLPTHQLVGSAYGQVQILLDAIERAGTLDKQKVNAALAETDLMTIRHRAKYDENQFSRFPICFGQWFKTSGPQVWDFKVIYSQHDFYPPTAEPIFPLP
ncbi:MAG: hypothetical protein A2144_03525 [Chloroflexi bacterium RBG_16_50_9]|nr:MAG: hypothetical protein A2144_03525 [Chloroflexi bacterium RBG_16_50_9]